MNVCCFCSSHILFVNFFVFLCKELFGSLAWSSSETRLVYIAEKKKPKTISYFDPKSKKTKSEETEDGTSGKDDPIKVTAF